MTEMKRMSVCLPKEIEHAIIELRKTDEFCHCSYSEIIRKLATQGLKNFGLLSEHIDKVS